jgi:hypothetical protein
MVSIPPRTSPTSAIRMATQSETYGTHAVAMALGNVEDLVDHMYEADSLSCGNQLMPVASCSG